MQIWNTILWRHLFILKYEFSDNNWKYVSDYNCYVGIQYTSISIMLQLLIL